MYVKQLNAYTVAQLKEELTNRNLETTGKKAELIVRLAGYLEGKHIIDTAAAHSRRECCTAPLVTQYCSVQIYLWHRWAIVSDCSCYSMQCKG